jgi:hypothetical protein
MPHPCLTCIHPRREAIERKLRSSAALGAISKRFGISTGALQRHQSNHLVQEAKATPRRVAKSGRRIVAPAEPQFIEVGLVPAAPSRPEVEVELRADGAGTSLRLRGVLEPEALQVLAQAVVGWPGRAS